MGIPVIGITIGSNPKSYEPYAEAVSDAGAQPLLINPEPLSPADASEIISRIDGLLLSGGNDIHLKYFLPKEEIASWNEDRLKEFSVDVDEDRDVSEIPLTQAALDADLPVLGICRGFQVLNVVCGGRLIMDIPKQIATNIEHRRDFVTGESSKHSVNVAWGSRLAEILGGEFNEVNSRHHQGLTAAELAKSLNASALAPDGIVEAVESPAHSWVLAVQWHPERRADGYTHKPCRSLFRSFVEAAARRQRF